MCGADAIAPVSLARYLSGGQVVLTSLYMTMPESSGKENGGWRHLLRAWFYLTPNERLAIAVILGLLLLGLGARWWHLSHERSEDVPAPVAESKK